MWTVKSIDEADYGCEERMPGESLLVLVTIESDEGEVLQFQAADEWLLKQNINEGDEWPEDVEAFEKTSQSLNRMNEFMDHYMDALEDLNSEA